MYERMDGIRDQLRQDMIAAWNVDTVIFGEPEESDTVPYGVILCGNVTEGEYSTPTLIDEVYPWALIGRFRKTAGTVTQEEKTRTARALTDYLVAGPNYATHGFLPQVGATEFDEMDEGDQPEWEIAIAFSLHAYGARNGTSITP